MLRVKKWLKKTVVYDIAYDWLTFLRQRSEYRRWQSRGGLTPHFQKQRTVKAYAQKFSLNTFVETGTYLGLMIQATKRTFKRIYSIELDNKLYLRAMRKFKRFKHITVLNGDSSTVLPNILSELREPCLFWLDAHYSGGITAKGDLETPVMSELNAILDHSITFSFPHIILIDDAREFLGKNDYPTLSQVADQVKKLRPASNVEVHDDIIRIYLA